MLRFCGAPGGGFALCLAFAGAYAQVPIPDSHIAIEDPAELSKDEARKIYGGLKAHMATNYTLSQLPEIKGYQSWPLYNDAPYMSATHGQRYVNSYANAKATNYGNLGKGMRLPVGSVLAKDSITITNGGKIFTGALFGMEKLPEGTSPETADWRYFMVFPDGSLFGDTTGDNPQLVSYCHECHLTVADRDYTFFVPEEFRK